jgi:hypothetical protein
VPAVLLRRVSNGNSFGHWLRDSSRSSKTVWLLLSEVNSLIMRRKDHDSTYCNSRYHKVSSHYDFSKSTRHFQPHSLCFSMPFTCILFCLHGVAVKVNDIHILLPPMHDSPTFQNRTRHLSHSTYRQFSKYMDQVWNRDCINAHFTCRHSSLSFPLLDYIHAQEKPSSDCSNSRYAGAKDIATRCTNPSPAASPNPPTSSKQAQQYDIRFTWRDTSRLRT